MAMNELLANYYGTNGAGQREELEKSAQVELFAKLASDNGIDLNALSDEQVQGLWDSTFKTASDEEKKEEGDEEKKEKAKAEFAEKKEASDKLAEADFLGRTMAHAYVDELNKIGSTGFRAAGAQTIKERAGALVDKAKGHISSAKDKAMNRVGESVAGSVTGGAHKAMHPEEQKALREFGAKAALRGGAAVGAGATAAGGAAYAAHKHKQGSALDQVAAELAVEKAAEAGFDANEAAQRVDALLTLGVGDSEKVAAAGDFNEAVDVRSLELLEGAGYPVEWSKTAGADTFVSKAKSHLSDAAKATTLRSGLATRKALKEFGTGVDKSKLEKLRGENRKDIAKGLGKTVGLYGGGAAAVGGGAYAAHKRKQGSAEALDELALELAVEKAAEAGFDAEEAASRTVAVMTLGLEESAKVASAQDVEGAVEIRSLEILEAAGYPINWA